MEFREKGNIQEEYLEEEWFKDKLIKKVYGKERFRDCTDLPLGVGAKLSPRASAYKEGLQKYPQIRFHIATNQDRVVGIV